MTPDGKSLSESYHKISLSFITLRRNFTDGKSVLQPKEMTVTLTGGERTAVWGIENC